MEDTKRTDKEVLGKGIKTMLICLLLMFAGPTILHIAFSNQEKTLFIPLLVLGALLSLGAIYTLFKGIMTIMDSMFGSKK